MRSKDNFWLAAISMMIVIMTAMIISLSACGETVDYFLKNQAAVSSAPSSAASSIGPVFVPSGWIDHASNPLFGGSSSGVNRAYYPAVLKVGSTYHIWYGDGLRTRHAASLLADFSDITHPAPEVTVGGASMYAYFGSPGNGVYHPNVLYSASGWTINGTNYTEPFVMYATPNFDSVNVLVSFNGTNWTNLGTNTGIIGYAPQGVNVYNLNVLFEGGTNWKGYADNGGGQIQYYVSSNGFNWVGMAANILTNSFNSWEIQSNQIKPCVIKASNLYVIFYSSGWTRNDNALGCATSTDGMTFTKNVSNLIFSTNDGPLWKLERAYAPWVIPDGSLWRMYYSGRATNGVYSVGMATATN